jgi:hypothetical protein
MSRASIRAGIVAYLGGGSVTGLNTVYSASPKMIPERAYYTGTTTQGAVALVEIGDPVETRRAIGGATNGRKRLDYPVTIQIIFRYIAAPSADVDMLLPAMDAFDVVLDAIKARIRADRTAGGAVWEWGEQSLMDNIADPNPLASGAVEIWGSISTQATEWLNS